MSATRDAGKYAALFHAEAREHLDAIDAALLALEQAPNADGAAEQIATVFRGMHTIKGMAAAMGYTAVERLAHALEGRCEPVRHGDEALGATLVSLLLEGTEALRTSITDAAGGVTALTPAIEALLARLKPAERVSGIAALMNAMPSPETVQPREAGSAEHGLRLVEVALTSDCPLKGVRAMIVLTKLRAVGTVQRTTPPLEQWQDAHFEGVFAVALKSPIADADLAAAVTSAGEVARVVVRDPEQDAKSTKGRRAKAAPVAPTVTRTVRLDARRLDTLLELVGELVITRDRLTRLVDGMAHPDRAVQRTARDTARLVSALQAEVLQARLLPASDVFDRFPRLVRDVARELGKEVSFVVEGRELELDRSLLDAVGDPILHLLRNALDHGIEPPDERRARGKAPAGTLVLRAVRERSNVRIEVRDDGRGIDREAVLARAKAHGLLAESVPALDDHELLRVIAHPGLSTAKTITTLSGRGVGVDVVNTRVRALGGQLALESVPGQGTVFTLRVPVTIAIARALLVEVQGRIFAIPAVHVEECLAYHDSLQVHHAAGAAVTIRDEVVPLVALDERFGLAPSSASRGTEEQHLAIVELGGKRAALRVDSLVAQQDIVVKPLDQVRGATPWFSGATVLGDGRLALILDAASLL
ncbi:MAG: chemotaxis protein CheA [Gemmatimonadaceae bacterium]|nr:chemotaxis protein CheA [Gemmatimonadaceae bacterium]